MLLYLLRRAETNEASAFKPGGKMKSYDYALVTDELVIFLWDQQVLIDGQWQPHPEIVKALEAQSERD
jgi:hypothetical protein